MAFAQKINRVYNDQLCPGIYQGCTEQENVVLDISDRDLTRASISKRVGQSCPWDPGFGLYDRLFKISYFVCETLSIRPM